MINETITELYLPYPDKEDRLVRVYVPARQEGETLPVIYMTDGQNVLYDEYASFGCWYTPRAIGEEREATGQAAIIVAIHSDRDPMGRTNELTPKCIGEIFFPPDMPQEMRQMMHPEGEVFDDFVVNTVMPAVEERFPVKTGRTNTAFCGSSSGGLMAFYIALNHPDLFRAAGALSPAFCFYMPGSAENWAHSVIGEEPPYLYLYSGAGDFLEQQICQSTEAVYDALLECYPPLKLNEVILMGAKHHESAWEPIFKDFLHTFLSRRETF